MVQENSFKDTALIVLSCDGYSDLWITFIDTFFDNWANCPFSIYILSNTKKCEDKRIKTLLSGDDVDWSSSLRKGIEQLEEKNLFFFLEDAFLCEKVDNIEFTKKYNFFIENKLNYLRLRPAPKPDIKYNKDFGELSNKSMYRVSLYSSFWKKDVFLEILKDGESAWEFEINGTKRSSLYDKFFSTNIEFFNIIHGVERGKWINNSLKKLKNNGYIINSERKLLYKNSFEEKIKVMLVLLKHKFLDLFPSSKREYAIKFFGNIKRFLFEK
ncbi:hypothetical protein CPU12_11505 [Malaciobacter molluscorum LMG 25693]|uniref:Uncharacterized protein n=1 Tax=Malaciobacter molluscorum LMG 25693 TaxID=870501 RepID=A0A2G1DFD3_9BACT|nr:hypothetical protein [Malaciobacter molluscorum]AXX91784.1 hypothetical protein AMOL_0789 [Malaciobacter molluscorum LMG 25693]PHO17222.1 hypothetical protein CPU12_11505 [Malaciobacter molluscorum LMG 25693]